MHLLVLSAFRHKARSVIDVYGFESQCTFWCSVLSDGKIFHSDKAGNARLNAPFGAQCFPTFAKLFELARLDVSMHLLVLSAFRR